MCAPAIGACVVVLALSAVHGELCVCVESLYVCGFLVCLLVCVCVCVFARARVCVCVCVRACTCVPATAARAIVVLLGSLEAVHAASHRFPPMPSPYNWWMRAGVPNDTT